MPRSVSPAGPRPRVKLKDIAQATGFSVNTVSHALKDMEDISAQTRKLIQQKAREMGYIADAVAGSLRSGSTRTIAVILGDVANPHFGIMVRHIESTAFRRGYSTLIIDTDEDAAMELDAVRAAIGKRVDGIILCPTQKPNGCMELLQASGIPYVLIGRRFAGVDCDYVVLDDVEGGRLGARSLLDKGHRNILFLSGPEHISSARERLQGYLRACDEAGVAVNPTYVRSVGIKSGQCSRVMRQAVGEKLPFTAVQAFSDIVALEAMSELRLMGDGYVHIPVVGFDDILAELRLPVPLASIASAEGPLAEKAAELLLRRIGDSEEMADTSCQIVLKVKLVTRNNQSKVRG